MSNGQQRLTAAFRKLFVETGLFARWVVVKDVFFAILRQGVIRFHIGLIAAWNGRHPALIGRRFVDICSGQVWQRNRFESISGGRGLGRCAGIGSPLAFSSFGSLLIIIWLLSSWKVNRLASVKFRMRRLVMAFRVANPCRPTCTARTARRGCRISD